MESQPLIISPTNGICQRVKTFLSFITIEPVVFLIVFSYGILFNVTPTLLLDRCCRKDYGFSKDICDNLDDHPEELSTCQKWSNEISLYKTLGQCLPNAFVTFFSGAWTDKYGRKIGLLIPIFFYALEYIFCLVFSLYDQLSDQWYILSAASGLGGGIPLFLASTFSYIAEISSVEKRNLRISLIDGSLFIAFPIGSILSGILLKTIDFPGVFALASACMALSFVYILFRIDYARDRNNDDLGSEGTISHRSFCMETLNAVFGKRPERNTMLLLIISMLLYVSTNSLNIYFYTMVMYHWTEEMYSDFFAAFVLIDGFFSYVVYPFIMNKLNVSDPTLAIVGELSALVRSFFLAYSFDSCIFVLGYMLGVFGSYTSVVIRSTVSKICPKENVGKVFAVLGGLEALVPMISSTIFTYIYNHTVDTYPGWMFIGVACVHSAIIVLMLAVHYIYSKASNQSWLMEFYET